MQGTALLLLTIAISISMLISGLFTLEKKINSNSRCMLTTKVNKKVPESGCDRKVQSLRPVTGTGHH